MPQFYYVLFVFIPMVVALAAAYVHRKNRFRAFSAIDSRTLPGGAEAAKLILDSAHLFDIRIQRGAKEGNSSYSLQEKTVVLSPFDYDSRSFTAIGRAQHQAAHAVQHMEGNTVLFIKAYAWPCIRILGTLSLVLVPLSFLRSMQGLYACGVLLFTFYMFCAFFVFSLEINASRLVIARLVELEALPAEEVRLLEKVLEAAALGCMVSLFFPFERLRIPHASQS